MTMHTIEQFLYPSHLNAQFQYNNLGPNKKVASKIQLPTYSFIPADIDE